MALPQTRPTALRMPTAMLGRDRLERPAHGDAPLADAHFRCGADLGHRQRLVGLDLQQHDHAVVVGGHQLGRLARAVGQPHEDRGRLVDEVERAGDDVAARIDDQPGGRARAEEHPIDPLQAADGFDADHRRGHAIDGRRSGPFAPACRGRRPAPDGKQPARAAGTARRTPQQRRSPDSHASGNLEFSRFATFVIADSSRPHCHSSLSS